MRQRAWTGQLERALGCAAAMLLMMGAGAAPSLALEEPAGEYEALKACEKRICAMILEKKPVGDDLTCKLSKTWAKDTIKGGESKTVKWGFGDARCVTKVKLSRGDIVAALTKPEHTINVDEQTVRCEIERGGELKPVTAKASPRMDFKKGQAEKVWINLKEIDGPTDIKGTIWTAASLEDSLGLFHGAMIKQINKFMHKKCAQEYGPGAERRALRKLRRQQAKEKRAKADKEDATDKPASAAKSQADGR